jgi:hypothetical protein
VTNAIFGFPRATSSFTLSGGSWNATYPESNLLSLPLSKVARTTDATSANTIIKGSAAVSKRVGIVALARHNFSSTAKIRFRAYSDSAWTTQIYDSGIADVWPTVYPFDTLEWEDDSYWTGKYTAAELVGTSWLWFLKFASTGLMVGSFEIDITDTGNAAGYVEAGAIELAAAFEVTYNPDFGMNYGFRWRSQATEALGGAQYIDRRVKPRVAKGQFKYSPRDEAMAKHFERERQLDFDQPLLFVPFLDETLHQLRTAMLARQVDPGLAALTAPGFDTVPLALEEIIG